MWSTCEKLSSLENARIFCRRPFGSCSVLRHCAHAVSAVTAATRLQRGARSDDAALDDSETVTALRSRDLSPGEVRGAAGPGADLSGESSGSELSAFGLEGALTSTEARLQPVDARLRSWAPASLQSLPSAHDRAAAMLQQLHNSAADLR